MISFSSKLLAGLFCFTITAFAGNMPSCPCTFWPSEKQHYRTSIRYIEGGGIGYNKGYTSFDGFLTPDPRTTTFMPFVDLRGHVFNNGKIASNVGIGFRKISKKRVYGLNTYYDYRHAKNTRYNQMGFGFETLGTIWDFRANGYLPFSNKLTPLCQPLFAKFTGHHMILSQKNLFAMKGFNTEFGFHVGQANSGSFYVAGGPYYFIGKAGLNAKGGKIRLVGRFKDYVTIELSNSWDNIFHNRFQCQLTFTLPFGDKSCAKESNNYNSCATSDALYSRAVWPIERQEIIVAGYGNVCTPAVDPATCEPFNFVFVDNTSHSEGTYESPYPTLALAQENSKPGDIIYVFPGNGTTQGMDAGITLKFNQKFWGSGTNHPLQTAQGNSVIPALSSSAPKVTNPIGNGITLASVNDVSGFILTEVFENAIFGTDLKQTTISDCIIDHSQFNHIHLEYNKSESRASLNNLILKNGAQMGIFINSTASSMECSVNNCSIQDNGNDAINASFANQTVFNFTNNTIERNVNNSIINFTGPAMLTVSGNRFINNTSINIAPITVTAGASPLFATITDNIIQANVCGAIHFALIDTNAAELSVNRNIISNNGSGSIGPFGASILINPNGTTSGNCNLIVTENVFSDNVGSSLYCANGSFNNFQVNASNNKLTENGGGGYVFANPCNTFSLAATNNIISNGNDHGITTGGGIIMDTANILISDNQIIGNANLANGIALNHEGSMLNLVITNNNISNNETSGIVMYSSSTIEKITVDIENNIINNNQNLGSNATGGVDLEQFTNLSGIFANNTLFDNVGSGLFIDSTNPSPVACLNMQGNNSNTGYTVSNSTGTFNLAPCNVDTVNIGAITTIGAITPVQSCPNAIPC